MTLSMNRPSPVSRSQARPNLFEPPLTSEPRASVALPAAILDFRRGGINLGSDIEQLQGQYSSGSYAAVLFFCGRILEALTSEAMSMILGEASTSAASNLRCLAEVSAVNPTRLSQLSSLRQLATDAVLARRTVHASDADCALLLLDRLLNWFFVELAAGPQLPTGQAGMPRVRRDHDAGIATVLTRLESGGEWRDLPEGCPGAFLATPAVPALYIDRALSALEATDTTRRERGAIRRTLGKVLTRALRCFDADVRLRQLHAVVLGIEGDQPFALQVLKSLNREHPGDSETLHLMAYQFEQHALSLKGAAAEAALAGALESYQAAWSCSQETDRRCGLKAAILGLQRGRTQRAEAIASRIVDGFTRRWVALGERFEFSGFQDIVTLAHASLILGESDYARRRYRDAFEEPPRALLRTQTKQEIRTILAARGLAANPQRFLDGHLRRRRRSMLRQLELPFPNPPTGSESALSAAE